MTLDPLMLDVLRDPATIKVGDGLYQRRGVLYEFTQEEIQAAVFYFVGQAVKNV